jgi:hypothetical protein
MTAEYWDEVRYLLEERALMIVMGPHEFSHWRESLGRVQGALKMVDGLRKQPKPRYQEESTLPTIAKIIEGLEFHLYIAGCLDDNISMEMKALQGALDAMRPFAPKPIDEQRR